MVKNKFLDNNKFTTNNFLYIKKIFYHKILFLNQKLIYGKNPHISCSVRIKLNQNLKVCVLFLIKNKSIKIKILPLKTVS